MTNLRDFLATRRSVVAANLTTPGPDKALQGAILTAATRVPDHGKLAPWRFVVFEGEARERADAALAPVAEATGNGKAFDAGKGRLSRAPVVVAVISTAAPHAKIPEWEQVLSAGAVCLNALHAAEAHGFAAQWLTEWIAYEPAAAAALGIAPGEAVAGFIHIGTPAERPSDRARPDLDALVTRY